MPNTKQQWLPKLIANLKSKIKPYLTPKMFISFGIAWVITNGWSYVFILVGWLFNMPTLLNIGLAYNAFLWLPFTYEKPITFAIAIFTHKLLFGHKPIVK